MRVEVSHIIQHYESMITTIHGNLFFGSSAREGTRALSMTSDRDRSLDHAPCHTARGIDTCSSSSRLRWCLKREDYGGNGGPRCDRRKGENRCRERKARFQGEFGGICAQCEAREGFVESYMEIGSSRSSRRAERREVGGGEKENSAFWM
ncbi:hypothetical protein AAMO2058_001097300 [Amorphochlora amoebiformis]